MRTKKIGGGLLILVTAAVPLIAQAMGLRFEHTTGVFLMIGFGVLAMVGLFLALSGPDDSAPSGISVKMRDGNHVGHIGDRND